MVSRDYDELNFTDSAWNSMYDAVEDIYFRDKDAQLIYDSLYNRLRTIPFGDYLKRYIYEKAELSGNFREIELEEYKSIIKESFKDNHTPCSFEETKAKISALSKNWLTQQSVRRNVVFLLGFGLNMSVDDVNMFLTKALREQEINPKDPFEVICWYCYKNNFNYLKFEKLWAIYKETPPNTLDVSLLYSEQTINVRNTIHSINNDAALIAHISKMKSTDNVPHMSVTARKYFDQLYDEARDIVVNIYNQVESEEHSNVVHEYQYKLSRNDRLYDYEKRNRIEKLRAEKRRFVRDDISESDIEHIICASIPTDKHGNLVPSKKSKLNAHFEGKRFSRQRMREILSEATEVNRFDLITLNFFIFSQRVDEIPDEKRRYIKFLDSTNEILKACSLGELYIQNPYECFVLMCILSDDPLGTYADVWELAYDE